MDFLGMGMGEILLILILAVIVLGPGKVADFAKTLGKWTRVIRKASNDFTFAVKNEIERAEKAGPDVTGKNPGVSSTAKPNPVVSGAVHPPPASPGTAPTQTPTAVGQPVPPPDSNTERRAG